MCRSIDSNARQRMALSTLTRRGLGIVVLVLLGALPAAAHDMWIEPSTFHPAPGANVTVALLVGQKLAGEPLPRDPLLIDRFVLTGGRAEVSIEGEPGDDPAGSVRVREPGLHWIGYQSQPYPLVLDAAKFEAYLKDEGLERIVEARAKQGQSAAPGRERFHRCAKALLVVGQKGTAVFDAPLGFTLELVPLKNPYALAPGGELPLALSFRGKPIEGVLVVALDKGAPDKAVSARTDAQGHVTLRLDRPGFWLIKAVHMQPAAAGAGVDWESFWASITFDLGRLPRK
jgi:uncharacterized GH25 family protein